MWQGSLTTLTNQPSGSHQRDDQVAGQRQLMFVMTVARGESATGEPEEEGDALLRMSETRG